VKTIWGLFT